MLWDYQLKLAAIATKILLERKIVYLAMEMRVGKTLIALDIARRMEVQRVLFITKKKAISSIQKDYIRGNFHFLLDVRNYEQLHKVKPIYDLFIVDEAHLLGAFPRPSLRARRLKKLVQDRYLILLSGTPTPESYSQIFHQFWISNWSPFPHKNFYQWAKDYVNVYEMRLRGVSVRKYERADWKKIEPIVKPYFITYTREQAGFKIVNVKEYVHYLQMKPFTYRIADSLIKKGIVQLNNSIILADDPGKKLWKVHQIFSGTVLTEDGRALLIDDTKARYISHCFNGKKIVIFYKYRAEAELLKKTLSFWTEDPKKITPSTSLLTQIQSGSMGMDYSNADAVVFFNIDFSATNYWQARARIFHKNRTTMPEIHWLFAVNGIEKRIFTIVRKKRDYTVSVFKKELFDVGEAITGKNIKIFT